ncbi:hypothetical protein AB0G81_39405 [Streptomyces asoensis]|uniref:hypothetical protein n=1 Tax=Streptomyces asoensis TaxID=249586 RepID=UPI0033D0D260
MATTASTASHASLASFTLEVADLEAAQRFYTAFGVADHLRLKASAATATRTTRWCSPVCCSPPAAPPTATAARGC